MFLVFKRYYIVHLDNKPDAVLKDEQSIVCCFPFGQFSYCPAMHFFFEFRTPSTEPLKE